MDITCSVFLKQLHVAGELFFYGNETKVDIEVSQFRGENSWYIKIKKGSINKQ